MALWARGQSTRRMRIAAALSEVSVGAEERTGDEWRLLDDCLDSCGGVEVELLAAIDVLLKVGTAFGRG